MTSEHLPPSGAERLVEVVQELSRSRDLETVMEIVRGAARELTGADGATFILWEDGHCYYADEDAIAPLWKGQRFPSSACISGWVMEQGEPAVIEDIYADERIPADAYRPTFVRSLAMVPVRPDSPVAAIGTYWSSHHRTTPAELRLLQALADSTVTTLELLQSTDTAQKNAELNERLAQSEAQNRQLVDILEATPDFVGLADANGRVLYHNPSACRLLTGSERGPLGQETIEDARPEWARQRIREEALPAVRHQGVWHGETAYLRPGGHEIPVYQTIMGHFDNRGRLLRLSSISRDISEQKQAELALAREQQAAEALRRILEELVHEVPGPEELFQRVCQLAVDSGGFRLAWIGRLDSGGWLRPEAGAGETLGYLDGLVLSRDPERIEGQGPAGQALRTGETQVVQNIWEALPTYWSERLAQAGLASVSVLPFYQNGRVVGSLQVYAALPDYFHESLIEILEQTARTVGVALERHYRECERRAITEILEATPDGVAMTDAQGQILYRNPALRGYLAPFSDPNRPFLDLSYAHPPWACQLLKEEAFPSARRHGVWQGETASYDMEAEEVPMSQVLLAHRDQSGTVHRYSTILRDLSAHKALENQLRQERDFFDAVVESLPGIFLLLDGEGRLRQWNHNLERILGYGSDELVGSHAISLITEEDRQRGEQAFARVWEAGEAQIELEATTRSGETVPLFLAAFRIEAGGHTHMAATGIDISERLAAEAAAARHRQALAETQRLASLGQVGSTLAHQLHQPLTAATNFQASGLNLLSDEGDPETARSSFHKALGQIYRVQSLVNNIRYFLRQGEPSLTATNPADLATQTQSLLDEAAQDYGHTLTWEVAPALPTVECDPLKIQEVLLNLVQNALEAMPQGGAESIQIRLSPAQEGVEISVADAGPGLPEPLRVELHQPFFTTKADGMGLGLPICKSIIEAHGGHLWAESGENGGTIFRFILPASPKDPKCQSGESPTPSPASPDAP